MCITVFRNAAIIAAITVQASCGNADKTIAQSSSPGSAFEHKSSSTSEVTGPNVLLIVADDLGFSDLGAFGGEIETPNLDALAFSGIRMTGFYAMPNCSPTRSMLLTGQDNHTAGMGAMAEAIPAAFPFLMGKPGYEGYLIPQTTTIAEKFSEAGYRTMMSGKWHLGYEKDHQPSAHGFERSFVLLEGGGDHFGYGQNGDPALEPVRYTENGLPAEYPVGVYSSDFYASQLIEYLSADEEDDRPFFAYLAFTAPHWPLQAPEALIAKYEGRYDAGPEALRIERLTRMKDLGLLEDSVLSANLEELADWKALGEDQRKIQSRKMEIYAAMVDSLDQNVGKVIQHLRESGELENTVVFFMSDNGAEGIDQDSLIKRSSNTTPTEFRAQVMATIEANNTDLSRMGSKDSFLTYGDQWAKAAAAPFRDFKSETNDGGIRVPAFITGPEIKGNRIVGSLLSVRDIMPTTLDLAGIPYDVSLTTPTKINDDINAPIAKSWLPILSSSTDSVRTKSDALAWELHMRRAVRLGDWKAVYEKDDPARANDPKAPSSWKLFNMKIDAGESQDVRADHPAEFERLMSVWDVYAEENGVFIPGGSSQNE